MRSKICGIPSIAVAEKIIAYKPDAVGIYCWTEVEKGANFTDIDTARRIAALAAMNAVDTFYLTYATTAEVAAADCAAIGNSHIQLLGDMPVEEVTRLKALMPALQTVKVIGVTGTESLAEARKYAESEGVDQLLLDSRSGNVRGGTGKTHDWNVSREIVTQTNKPVWLAGGIRLHNVEEAMATVQPYGIDVETGVQNPDGSKNYEAIEEFVALVHAA